MSLRPGIANLLWFAFNAPGYRTYRSALREPRRVQESLLASTLRRNADTVFGRRHGFARIRSLRDFQARVPLSTYEDYVPYIERIAGGEAGCLTRESVKLFAPTSGSTGAAKWIPYTASLQAEFRRAVAPWVFDLMARRPRLLGGPAYWSITPAIDGTGDRRSEVPVGFDEDSASLGGALKSLVDATLVVPGAVSRIRDVELFRRVSLLFLLRHPGLRLISVWHPSFLRLLLGSLKDDWDRLVSQVYEGFQIDDPGIAISADPVRARVLDRLGPARPAEIWPRLGLISCWGDGHAAGQLAEIRELFPQAEVQTKGLIATEAFVSLPFDGQKPLAVTSHFFEFLDDDGRARPAWELRQGGVYSLAVTTGGGLYRYRIEDRVEVTGFVGGTPSLRFLGKMDSISDLCGEKLSEGFVGKAVASALRRAGVRTRFAMLAPDRRGGVSRYLLFIETAQDPPSRLTADLEAELRANPHYDYCIRLGQLAPVQVRPVAGNAYNQYSQRLLARGQRLGDIKLLALSALPGWGDVFDRREPAR